MMDKIIELNKDNIANEHICCAISDKKCLEGYNAKKEWLKTEFENGYSFQKLNVRGKVFIEYVPIEKSWLPLEGKNFMVINCFWVSGQFKKQGNGKKLLLQVIKDAKAKGMDGIVAITSEKKRPFMTDPKFLKYQGFEVIDEAPPFFRLMGIKLNSQAKFPKIMESAKSGTCPNKKGITVYYSNTCPFTDYYVNVVTKEYAKKKNVPIAIHHLKSREDGKKMPIPWVINSVFYNGELISLEMKVNRHLDKLIN